MGAGLDGAHGGKDGRMARCCGDLDAVSLAPRASRLPVAVCLMLLLSAVSLAGCPFGWQESGPIAGREKAELQWTRVKAPALVVADSGSDSHVDRWQW